MTGKDNAMLGSYNLKLRAKIRAKNRARIRRDRLSRLNIPVIIMLHFQVKILLDQFGLENSFLVVRVVLFNLLVGTEEVLNLKILLYCVRMI